jgi:hypothetical protein
MPGFAQYLQDAGLNKGLKGKYAQYVLKMREWDLKTALRFHFIAIQNMLPNALKVFTSERQR